MPGYVPNDDSVRPELTRLAGLGFTRRQPGSGVPVERWTLTDLGTLGHYPGHVVVTTDPAGVYRTVADGFVDDMRHVVELHNAWVEAVLAAEADYFARREDG